jgi:hypothetical protein
MPSLEELKKLKDGCIRAEDEAIESLDRYYQSVENGRGLTASDLLVYLKKIKTAVSEHKHASENYIVELEEIANRRSPPS